MNRLTKSLILILLALSSYGCLATGRTASPETTLGIRKGDTTTTLGNVGGEGDSIALWLAIAALATVPLAYPIQRRLRLRKNGLQG
jgi:hypothetical protein